ncbi:MAG TPA: HAMP domain-containing sensor histidine kinase [Terriglobia bacterium]|nr:HAMP domain-containing sensor histidine kinase [Terriglobia bacterium]
MAGVPVSREQHLLSVIKQLSFCRTLEEVTEVVRHAARDLTGADGVTFILREGDNVYYAGENAIAPLWKGMRFPTANCVSGWTMLNRQSAVIEDVYQDPRVPVEAYKSTFVKSMAMIPVRAEEPTAAIGAYWATHHRATKEEIDKLQMLADATALALRNVELLSDLQAAVDREHQARVEAEAANRAKDEWLSVISHEMRTPLTPIHGWLQLLIEKRLDASRTEEALRVIDRNLMAHTRLVEDLLDVSRMLSGKFEVKQTIVDMRECVSNAVAIHQWTAKDKSVSVNLALSDQPYPVIGDSDRICQIVYNLVHNALKFTRPGGRIDVSLASDGTQGKLTVSDNGIGIAPDMLPQLFRRFRQADSSSTRAAGGLGLGLWIVQQLVEKHGGTVTVSSLGEGKGAVFTVRLPLVTRPVSGAPSGGQ